MTPRSGGVDPAVAPVADAAPATVDVSVLTASYQYARYIDDTIASVAQQRGVTVQHLVQDGCSTDGTVDVLRRWGERVDWRSEPDDGQSDALNRALRRARGRWVAWLNADEFYLPDVLARLVEAGERTGAAVVYADTVFVDGDGGLMRLAPQHGFSDFVVRSYGPFIGTESLILRRDALDPDPIDVSFRRMMDWDLFLRLIERGAGFTYVPMPGGAFRAHDARLTATERRGFLTPLRREGVFGQEYDELARRYGALRHRRAGQVVHGWMKLRAGSYVRQVRARALTGTDLRWFAGAEGERGVRELLRRCYGAA
jgi:glycosyltransferase involved in cell wall biosynthesis